MNNSDQRPNAVWIARRRRYLHLLEKVNSNKKLSAAELREFEEYEMIEQEKKKTESSSADDSTSIRSQSAAAAYCGVTIRTIRNKEKDYPLKDGRGNYIPAMLDQYVRPATIKKNGGLKEKSLFADLELKKRKSQLAQWELDLRAGKYIETEKVKEQSIAKILEVKRTFLSLPRKLSAQLEHKPHQFIQVKLEEELAHCLDVFAGEKLPETDKVTQLYEFYNQLTPAEKKQFKEKINGRNHKQKATVEQSGPVAE